MLMILESRLKLAVRKIMLKLEIVILMLGWAGYPVLNGYLVKKIILHFG